MLKVWLSAAQPGQVKMSRDRIMRLCKVRRLRGPDYMGVSKKGGTLWSQIRQSPSDQPPEGTSSFWKQPYEPWSKFLVGELWGGCMGSGQRAIRLSMRSFDPGLYSEDLRALLKNALGA